MIGMSVRRPGQQAGGVYNQTTYGIRVTVTPSFLVDQSVPDENLYVWAYHVIIENLGDDTVQLMTRHWRITNACGVLQEIRGEGVVGQQPVLAPGDSFEYTSGCPLTTSSGFMMGSYRMLGGDGSLFDVDIPAFSLDSPYGPDRVH